MNRYVRLLNETNKGLGRECGVSHSQVHMARFRNVGFLTAEKIASHIAGRLGLSEREKLELEAEIMGLSADPLRAWFGNASEAARLLDECCEDVRPTAP